MAYLLGQYLFNELIPSFKKSLQFAKYNTFTLRDFTNNVL